MQRYVGNDISIEASAFEGCSGLKGSLVLPQHYLGKIGYGAFNGCSSINSVTLLRNNCSIGDAAFKNLSENSVIYTLKNLGLKGKYSNNKTVQALSDGNIKYTFIVDDSSFSSGFPLTNENAPVKEGYVFDGWYDNPTFGGEKITSVKNGEELYVKWISETGSSSASGALTDIKTTTATPTTTMATTATAAKTPFPVFGILAGLGAAALFLRRKN